MALVDDYDVVVIGLAHLFDPYRDRIVVAELDANEPVIDDVDVVLYDSFAQPEADHDDIAVLVANPRARHVVVYTWNFHPALIESALAKGASGYLSKTLPARDLVTAIEAIAAGEVIVSEMPPRSRPPADLTGPDAARASPTAKPRSLRSSPKARPTSRSPQSCTSASTPSSPTSAPRTTRSA